MNTILNSLIAQRNGNYCHALELASAEALEQTIEEFIFSNARDYTLADYTLFFTTAELYYLPLDDDDASEDDENTLYNVDIKETVKEIYNNLF